MGVKHAERNGVYLVNLDPTKGHVMAKTRPCVVVSPDQLNKHLKTVIVAPITSTLKEYPWRIKCKVAGKWGTIATDQLRTIDKERLEGMIDRLDRSESEALLEVLRQMFQE
ncbi:MAG: type II toxin-antitoxin system PemK/MazF family toxin [Bacteroidota bacterium]|nr:type II toxin-antitoxin system PemK/MazF family toxin [Bacteroidota bacterium]